jgi:hypothetical protein
MDPGDAPIAPFLPDAKKSVEKMKNQMDVGKKMACARIELARSDPQSEKIPLSERSNMIRSLF